MDPLFFSVAALAVLVVGVSKGGLGGGLVVLGVPIMSLVVSPTVAAGILLPILCVMDLANVWAHRGKWDKKNLALLIPGSIIGILLGTFTYQYMNDSIIRLIVGSVAIIFSLSWFFKKSGNQHAAKNNTLSGLFWGGIAGFTSFVAHSGGPPMNIHLIPQNLNKRVYQATTAMFFTVANYVKLLPYALLGVLEVENLKVSLLLMPVGLVGIALGVWLHTRINEVLFYRLVYIFLFFTGLKLLFDGTGGLFM